MPDMTSNSTLAVPPPMVGTYSSPVGHFSSSSWKLGMGSRENSAPMTVSTSKKDSSWMNTMFGRERSSSASKRAPQGASVACGSSISSRMPSTTSGEYSSGLLMPLVPKV